MGLRSAVLVVQPPPAEEAIPRQTVEGWIQRANAEAMQAGVRGNALTPYLLRRVDELSNGQALRVNLALLLHNARLAAQIAVALAHQARRQV
jgi:pseudouridine-5'-phosphate glycosidase